MKAYVATRTFNVQVPADEPMYHGVMKGTVFLPELTAITTRGRKEYGVKLVSYKTVSGIYSAIERIDREVEDPRWLSTAERYKENIKQIEIDSSELDDILKIIEEIQNGPQRLSSAIEKFCTERSKK